MTAETYPTLRISEAPPRVEALDQRELPYTATYFPIHNIEDGILAIRDMVVRGAPLIGVTAAYCLWVEALRISGDVSACLQAIQRLGETRPTAVNLFVALEGAKAILATPGLDGGERCARLKAWADTMGKQDKQTNAAIGQWGLEIIQTIHNQTSRPVQILTHCNAGRLATTHLGTATAPIYAAHQSGIPVHVWVDETRPRNQGALTAWELGEAGVPCTVIADNAGGQLMRNGQVDLCLVGTDRTTRCGDVANKIGTYLKALAARDNGIPFYVCLPSSTIDWEIGNGTEIEIEERPAAEVRKIRGTLADGQVETLNIFPDAQPVANPAFDVTPGRLVDGLITERGVCAASENGLLALFPERA